MRIRLAMWVSCWAAMLTAAGCVTPIEHNLPPAERLMHWGPGVDGPGPGVMMPPASHLGVGMHAAPPAMLPTVQVLFARPEGMQVRWDVASEGGFDSTPLVVPGRQNFPQAAIYRLKLTNVGGREGVELYPTLEVGPMTPRSEAYLAHNAIPVQFTEEDFDQVLTGNFVTKVIYLPDPEFQELALAGVETLVSTRLDPGIDPITEADRRGAILAVIRLGNKDVELPGANGAASQSIPIMQADGSIMPISHTVPECHGGMPMAGGMPAGPVPMGPTGLVPQYVAGITAPEWGMPYTGTPIGLPGPPHIPLGGPAGLRQHTMRNHTRVHIPEPNKHLTVNVRQMPGYSYPAPANRVHITEQSIYPSLPYGQPHAMRHQLLPSDGGCAH